MQEFNVKDGKPSGNFLIPARKKKSYLCRYSQAQSNNAKKWPVEEDCKTMKQRIETENFSGRSVLSIYQDFHAKVFSKNPASVPAFPAQSAIDINTYKNRHKYKMNFAQMLSKIKDVIPLFFIRFADMVLSLISDLHKIITETIETVRPGRKYPRNFKNITGRFNYSYQPTR